MTYPTPSSVPLLSYPMRQQRRAERRRTVNASVSVLAPYVGSGVTINASRQGLRMAVDCVLATGDACMLRIDRDDQPPQLIRGRVVWTQQVGDGCIAGLELLVTH